MKLKTMKDRAFGKLYTRYPRLVRRWARKGEFLEFTDSPWTPPSLPPEGYVISRSD